MTISGIEVTSAITQDAVITLTTEKTINLLDRERDKTKGSREKLQLAERRAAIPSSLQQEEGEVGWGS